MQRFLAPDGKPGNGASRTPPPTRIYFPLSDEASLALPLGEPRGACQFLSIELRAELKMPVLSVWVSDSSMERYPPACARIGNRGMVTKTRRVISRRVHSLDFPSLDLAGLFVELQIALIPALFDFPGPHGGPDGAVRLFSVGTVVKAAFSEIASKIREGVL